MGKILVIDNDVNIRNFCYDAFTQAGHRVLTFPFTDKILPAVKQEKPDLILMDIRAVGPAGFSFLKTVSQSELKIPVVGFSDSVTPEQEKNFFEAGAIEVFRKDLSAAELCLRISKVLDAKRRLFGQSQDLQAKILIVDDESSIRELLKDFFEEKGFRVFTAGNGEQALPLLDKERPNVILLDISMPGMDGILTLKKIRERDSKVGVLMVTSIQDDKIMDEASKLGAYAYILKPFDLQYLELIVMTRIKIAGA